MSSDMRSVPDAEITSSESVCVCRHHDPAGVERLSNHCQQHSTDHIGRYPAAWLVSYHSVISEFIVTKTLHYM